MKKFLQCLMVIGIVFGLLACSGSKSKADGEVKIGLATISLADQWGSYLYNSIEKEVKSRDNASITILDAQEDAATQISQVENLITTGHDAILVMVVDRGSIENMSRLAREAGVVLTLINRAPEEKDIDKIDLYVGIDEKEAGRVAARQLVNDLEARGQLNDDIEIGLVRGIFGHDAEINRSAGFIEYLSAYPNLKITREGTGRWERGLAMTLVENWMQADKTRKMKVIFAHNDEMAVGASLAAKQSGRDDILIYGVDASPDGVAAVGNGIMATVEQDPIAMGEQALDGTLRILKGQTVPNLVDDKYIFIPLNTVTIDNKADFEAKSEEIRNL